MLLLQPKKRFIKFETFKRLFPAVVARIVTESNNSMNKDRCGWFFCLLTY